MRRRSNQGDLRAIVLVSLLVAGLAFVADGQDPPADQNQAKAKAKEKAKDDPKAEKAKPAPKPKGTPRAKVQPSGAEPVVMSREAAAIARGKPIEAKGYDGEPDWSEVPAWRQASFFDIKAEGQVFIFVVDCSGSMIDEDRLDRAKRELMRSVRGMQMPQRFKVIFYNDRPLPMPGDVPRSADLASKGQLARWLTLIEPEGGTDPRAALSMAVGLRPDAVFLLSDGAFPEGTVEAIAKGNPKKVPIHCVDLAGGAAGDDLARIAKDSGGRYAARGR